MVNASQWRGVGLALVIAEVSIFLGPPPLRVPGGLILGLILPGLVIAPLLSRPRMERAERLLLVPGMSIVTAMITGLVMSAAAIRLNVDSWAVALGLVTAASLAISVVLDRSGDGRRKIEPPNEPTFVRASRNAHRRLRTVAAVAMLPLAALLVAGALMIGIWGEHYRGPGFTELWALPGQRPTSPVRLGVISHEGHDVRYTLRVSIEGRVIRTQQIALRPGETWQSMQPVGTASEEVDVLLQKSPSAAVYREVHVLVGRLNG